MPSFLFIHPIYNKALNIKFNNLKFTFAFSTFCIVLLHVFFYLLHSTFTIFGPIACIYLISVDDGVDINITRIMLLIEESGNIYKSFIRMPIWSDAG